MRSWGRPPASQALLRGPLPPSPRPPRPLPRPPPPQLLLAQPLPCSISRRCLRSPVCKGSPVGSFRLRARSFSFRAAPSTPRAALTLRALCFALPLRRSSCRARVSAVFTSRLSRLRSFFSSCPRSAAHASAARRRERSRSRAARSSTASLAGGAGAAGAARAVSGSATNLAAAFAAEALRRRFFSAGVRW